jgi:hypothetical protein
MSKKKDFYRDLAMSESSNNPKAINKGYIGLYQMGEAALVDVEYYNEKYPKLGQEKGAQYNNDWTSSWSGKNGIDSRDDFLNSSLVQNIAVREYHQKIWFYLRNYHFYEDKEVGGILLTKSAMLAGGHLVGAPAVRKFINSEGEVDKSDANLVRCSTYMRKFSGYEVDYEIDELMKTLNDGLEFADIPEYHDDEDSQDQTLAANKIINKQIDKLLSNPSELHKYQQESLDNAMQDLKLAEGFVPNITKSGLESMGEHYEFMQQLIGIKDPTLELQKIKKLEEEEEKFDPYLQDLVQSFQNPQTFIAAASTKPKTQEQKVDHEDNDWLNALLSNTASMMHEASSDPEMQQFLKTLGNNSGLNFGDEM